VLGAGFAGLSVAWHLLKVLSSFLVLGSWLSFIVKDFIA
jgi:glycine/D-amino acid oxidase-like deaminating enzyme